MQVLQRLDGLYIKASYLAGQQECTISNVTISMAREFGDPNFDYPARSVEECACPSSYTGQSAAQQCTLDRCRSVDRRINPEYFWSAHVSISQRPAVVGFRTHFGFHSFYLTAYIHTPFVSV